MLVGHLFKVCPFNTGHIIPKRKIEDHCENCPDKFRKDILLNYSSYDRIKGNCGDNTQRNSDENSIKFHETWRDYADKQNPIPSNCDIIDENLYIDGIKKEDDLTDTLNSISSNKLNI